MTHDKLLSDLNFFENTPWYLARDGMVNYWMFPLFIFGFGLGIILIPIYRGCRARYIRRRLSSPIIQ